MSDLKPCPCGATPNVLVAVHDDQVAPKWMRVSGDCCGEWEIECRNDYARVKSHDYEANKVLAWNAAPRAPAESELAAIKAECDALRRRLNIGETAMDDESILQRVCHAIRKHRRQRGPCKKCSPSITDGDGTLHGRGCRLMAEEMVLLATTGRSIFDAVDSTPNSVVTGCATTPQK